MWLMRCMAYFLGRSSVWGCRSISALVVLAAACGIITLAKLGPLGNFTQFGVPLLFRGLLGVYACVLSWGFYVSCMGLQ